LKRHDLLKGLHDVLKPRTYFEIGVRTGASLELSRTQSVAVDPYYGVTRELHCDVHLVRTTADEFFARKRPFAHFDVPQVDLAFIDGMHLAEYALRDFINTERYCHPGSVVVFDDMLPRIPLEAGRSQAAASDHGAWAGDVYKIVDTLRTLRPDLVILEMDTLPTGTLVVANVDPRNRVLMDAYDGLVVDYVTPDPQLVPEHTLTRSRAMNPDELLSSPVWSEIRRLRGLSHDDAVQAARTAYRAAGFVERVTR
jgi:hypothetical protein